MNSVFEQIDNLSVHRYYTHDNSQIYESRIHKNPFWRTVRSLINNQVNFKQMFIDSLKLRLSNDPWISGFWRFNKQANGQTSLSKLSWVTNGQKCNCDKIKIKCECVVKKKCVQLIVKKYINSQSIVNKIFSFV
jgi:hypothetical protein